MSDQEFACPATCQYAGKPWPPSKGKPTCRLFSDYMTETNPVTKASIRMIIRNRIGWMGEERPVKCEKDPPHVKSKG